MSLDFRWISIFLAAEAEIPHLNESGRFQKLVLLQPRRFNREAPAPHGNGHNSTNKIGRRVSGGFIFWVSAEVLFVLACDVADENAAFPRPCDGSTQALTTKSLATPKSKVQRLGYGHQPTSDKRHRSPAQVSLAISRPTSPIRPILTGQGEKNLHFSANDR